MQVTTHRARLHTPPPLIDAFNQAADILDNMEKCEPVPESGAAQIKYEYNKFGYVFGLSIRTFTNYHRRHHFCSLILSHCSCCAPLSTFTAT